ncbi:biosynthetic-type acetolactate synthase large subunit [soil metagenome]
MTNGEAQTLDAKPATADPTDARSDEARPPKTGAHEIVEFMVDNGYNHIFGLPGSQLVSIFHTLQKTDISFVPTIHESVTVAAADGYARVKGSAMAMLYMLPGTANGLANIYNAGRDDSPLILLGSQQLSTARTNLGAYCEGDTVPLVKPFVRLAHELTKGASPRSWLNHAKRVAEGTPGGPVFLSMCEDVLRDPAPVVTERQSSHGAPAVPDVRAVAEQLRTAERPLIVVGGQVRRLGGAASVEALAERYNIPVVFEGGRIDALGVAPGHSHCRGSIAMSGLEPDADVVLLLGTRAMTEASPRKGEYFAKARFVAQVNVDPTRLEAMRRFDWVSASDPAAFAAALLAALGGEPPVADLVAARADWCTPRPVVRRPGNVLSRLFDGFETCVAPLYDAMDRGWVVDESVMASGFVMNALKAKDGRRYAGTNGASLGWATGAAAGIALGSGEPVTCVIGDGSLRFGMAGLWTLKAMNLPVTLIILDNHGYGSTRNYERQYLGELGRDANPQKPGYLNMDMRTMGPDLADMIRGFGIKCTRLTREDDLRAAVEGAWADSVNGPNALLMPVGFEDE